MAGVHKVDPRTDGAAVAEVTMGSTKEDPDGDVRFDCSFVRWITKNEGIPQESSKALLLNRMPSSYLMRFGTGNDRVLRSLRERAPGPPLGH